MSNDTLSVHHGYRCNIISGYLVVYQFCNLEVYWPTLGVKIFMGKLKYTYICIFN